MIYIDAMRVRSPREGLGVNIFLHFRQGPVPAKFWTVSQDPGESCDELSWIEVKSGGNSVEAFVEMMLEDQDYSPDLLERALDELSRAVKSGARNPLTLAFPAGDGRAVHMVFSVNIGLEDLASKRRVLQGLSDKIHRWLRRYGTQIDVAISRPILRHA